MTKKTRVLVHGAMGRMGVAVRDLLIPGKNLILAGALESPDHPLLGQELTGGIKLSSDISTMVSLANVAISFSLPEPTMSLSRACATNRIACVIGTTGFNNEQLAEIKSLSEEIPIVIASNFSVTVNLLTLLVREAAKFLKSDYDAEIIELHHSQKIDAPSGTALELGKAVAEGREVDFEEVAVRNRDGVTGIRSPGSIGLQALRGGDVAGEHTVMIAGGGERLELSHRASTREHFAKGAIVATEWVIKQKPGLYDMKQVLGLG